MADRRWSAAFVGAVLCGGVLALTGNLSVDPERVIERVKVTPIVPAPGLPDDQTRRRGDGPGEPGGRPPPHHRSRRRLPGVRRGRAATTGSCVTSAHEIVGATAIIVELADGRRVEGTLVGADLPTDVGVITIEARGLPVAVLGSSDDLDVGAATVAIGTTTRWRGRRCRPA